MSCTKSELISAINSYAAARTTNDVTLQQFSSQLISECLETLEFTPEKKEVLNDDQSE
tara:strand:- start:8159 stop:8332 length:174 start_codon:yes stop_codon:yes gene_type:complete